MQPKYLTRRDAVDFLRGHGYPISLSTANKLWAPAIGGGPPATWWGKRPIYRVDDVLAWAESQIQKTPLCLHKKAVLQEASYLALKELGVLEENNA